LKTVPIDRLGALLDRRRDVVFAVLFGSARDGVLREGADLDIGVLFVAAPGTESVLSLMAALSDEAETDDIDFVDLSKADPILAFEAVSGRFLCKNDPDRTAAFVSLVSREYEDVMWRLQHVA